jgi:hypothetical protein
MWIQKLPTEVSLEKRAALLRATCLDILLGAGLWYILVRLSKFFGLPFQGSVSGYVGCAVITLLLPAAWYASRRASRMGKRTMVCDRCNVLKTSDDQPNCGCGGQYLPLEKMKWVDDSSSRQTFPMEQRAAS